MEISKNQRRLSKSEISQYKDEGYIKNLPVFSNNGVEDLQKFFRELKNRLPDNVDINKTNMWHKASRKFYDVAHTPAILDYVEDLLGSDFYLWGGQFFYKPAYSKSIVPWHQDSQYWPLEPSNSVTVWLAVFDTDKENSAMKIVSGSHKAKDYKHYIIRASSTVSKNEFGLELKDDSDEFICVLVENNKIVATRKLVPTEGTGDEILENWQSLYLLYARKAGKKEFLKKLYESGL